MKVITLADGTYSFRTNDFGAQTVATFKSGALVSFTYAGEARPCTDLAAQQIAHLISYLDGVIFTAPQRTIGNAAAHRLHKELGRLRFPNHYVTASEALGRSVASLAALTAEEARTVWSYARGQWSLSA